MLIFDHQYVPRGVCSFGITEAIGAGIALFGGAAAAEGGAALGAEALGAGALGGAEAGAFGGAALGEGAGLFGALEGGGGLALGATEGAGAGSTFGTLAEGALTGGTAPGEFAAGFGGGVASPAAASAGQAGTAFGADAAFAADPLAAGSLTNPATYGNVAGGTATKAAGGSVFSDLLGSAGKAISANPLQAAGIGVAGAGLGYNILQGSQLSSERKAVGTSAGQLGAQGQQLATYLQSGTLPPGLQAALDKKTAAADAAIVQRYAAMGLSGSSMEVQERGALQQQSAIEVATIGEKLLTTGINEIGLSDQLYAQLIGIDAKQNATTGAAISNFAAALAGGNRTPQKVAA